MIYKHFSAAFSEVCRMKKKSFQIVVRKTHKTDNFFTGKQDPQFKSRQCLFLDKRQKLLDFLLRQKGVCGPNRSEPNFNQATIVRRLSGTDC